jgi:hypothetical protein
MTLLEQLLHILSTGQEMIPACNAIDARAQDFVVNDELLLFILKTLAQCTRPLHSLLEMPDVFSLCGIEQCIAHTNRSTVLPLAAADTTAPRRGSSRGLWTVVADVIRRATVP